MKPQPKNYKITMWLKDWGYGAPQIEFGKDAIEAAQKIIDKIKAKYGDNIEFYITRIEPE